MTVPQHAQSGCVAPGYEAVWDLFVDADLGAGGGAFCAYVAGEKVLDVWGGWARPGVPWTQSTTTTLFSSTKGVVAACAAILHSQGLLDVEALVGRYWPEFAVNGKASTKVRHLLDHSSGVLGLPHADRLLDFSGKGWDNYDAIARNLATSAPLWEPGTRHAYHAVSFGWLVGEIVRRITGHTVGTFAAEELCGPLGLDLTIGTEGAALERAADVIAPEPPASDPDRWLEAQKRRAIASPGSPASLMYVSLGARSVLDAAADFLGRRAGRTPEIPGINGVGSARDLAAIYNMLVSGGAVGDRQMVSEKSIALFRSQSYRGPTAEVMPLALLDGAALPVSWSRWALGFELNLAPPLGYCTFGPGTDAYGHAGLGGQQGWADPGAGVAIGFVRSHMSTGWEPVTGLVDQLYRCAAAVGALPRV